MGRKISGGNHRLEVKKLDREILKLANQRAKAWLNVVQSAESGSDAAVRSIDQITAVVVASNQGPLSERAVSALFRELHSGSQALLKETRIACLGHAYGDSYLAALQQFGSGAVLISLTTAEAVFEEVSRGISDWGVVPLANSTEGQVADTLALFSNTPLKICGEIRLALRHCLLSKGNRAQVQQICSTPLALSQYRNWLSKHFPLVQQVPLVSMSAAAKLAEENESVAAIADEQAATVYRLTIIARIIEDNSTSLTRFAVIGKESAKRSGQDKTALMFETLHRPGALADVLAVFKRAKLNLTWIETIPVSNPSHEHMFFVEFEGHQTDARVRKALALLETKTASLLILGSYPGKIMVEKAL